MEFSFSINDLFGAEITRLDSKLVPYRSCPGSRNYKEQLSEVINRMGEASAKAQGLRGAITTSDKIKHTNQLLYVVKERGENNKGFVVGILKVGHKRLFVYDNQGCQHEMEPLCVLDFYVHESRQRQGYGRKLFEHMLQDQAVKPQHLAIDKPSMKFSSFLQKHYNLKATIPQVNNFVIFNGFFADRNKKSARRPKNTEHLNSSHNNNFQQQKETLQNVSARQSSSDEKIERPNSNISNSSGDMANNKLMGKQSLYSRHSLNPASPLPDIGQTKAASANSLYGRKVPSPPNLHNPSAYQDRRGHLKLNSQPVSLLQNGSINNSQSENTQQTDNKYMFGSGHSVHNNRSAYELQQRLAGKGTLVGQNATAGSSQNSARDALLPKNFVPYSNLKLPEPDPYSRRALSNRIPDTKWNVFGVSKVEPATGFANPQRFQNTRPW